MAKFQLFSYQQVNQKIKKITSFNFTRLYLKRMIILKMFISPSQNYPTEYFAVKYGQEMYLTPVIAINFVYYKLFLYFSSLSRVVCTL